MPDVSMPRLSDSMDEGTILKWLVAPGVDVSAGQEILELETDKATLTYEAEVSGRLEIIAAEGATVSVGTLIATIGERSDTAVRTPAFGAAAAGARTAEVLPATPAPPRTPAAARTPRATPLVRRLAQASGIDLANIQGSGPGGRIRRVDLDHHALQRTQTPTSVPRTSDKGETTTEPLTHLQRLVARRMVESRTSIPEFTLATEIDMEQAVALRTRLRAVAPAGTAVPTINDMVIKASALALREFPRANGSYHDAAFTSFSRINVGVAVATSDTLIVPTVFDADRQSLRDIASTTHGLAERVRANTITPPELSGGTFTVSNLGMYGITEFSAVINAPQVAILAVGALAQRAVVRDGEVVARHTMTVTLSCDHRILYGAEAARFAGLIRALLEEPVALLL